MIGEQNVAVKVGSPGQDKAENGNADDKEKESDWKAAGRVFGRIALLILTLLATFACGLITGGSLPHGLAGLLVAFSPGPLPSADRPQFTCAVLVNHTYGSVCVRVPSEPPAAQVHLQLLYCAGQPDQKAAGIIVVEGFPQHVAADAYQWVFIPDAPCTGAAEVVVWTDRAVGETTSLQVNVEASAATATPGKHP
jgi:hypothetical protein